MDGASIAPAPDMPEPGSGAIQTVGALDDAARVTDALGVAFATFQLFQGPDQHVAFVRAVEILGGAPAIRTLEVISDGFLWGRTPVPSSHPGAGRLAEHLFRHGVAAVRFVSHPTATDLVALFDVIRRPADDAEVADGPNQALVRRAVRSIRLIDKAGLAKSEEDDDRDPDKVLGSPVMLEVSDYVGQPEALAQRLLADAGEDQDALVGLTTKRYLEAMGMAADDDVWGRAEVVHTFVDTFFFFPRAFQAPLLAELLARRESPEFEMLLDQFTHHELQELAPFLDEGSHPLLVEYARIAENDEQFRLELDELISDTAPNQPAPTPLAARIGRVLRAGLDGTPPARQALFHLQGQLEDQFSHRMTAAGVMGGLLWLADNPVDTQRRLRIWARRLAGVIQAGDSASAAEWVGMLFDHQPEPPDPDDLARALGGAATPETVAALADVLREADEPTTQSLERILPFMADAIIDQLGEERDAQRRRTIIDMLGVAARFDPGPVVRHLGDPRWYLTRNLVFALGRCGDQRVLPAVRRMAAHPDGRVRREAIRAIHALGEKDLTPFTDALVDDDHSVRVAAATIIRSLGAPERVVPTLIEIVQGSRPVDVKQDAIGLLGSIPSEAGQALLRDLAGRRFAATQAARSLRAAAQSELDGPP